MTCYEMTAELKKHGPSIKKKKKREKKKKKRKERKELWLLNW